MTLHNMATFHMYKIIVDFVNHYICIWCPEVHANIGENMHFLCMSIIIATSHIKVLG